jgi:carbon storage regulator
MLVLRRRLGERVVIGKNIEVTVLELHKNHVKLGISGPLDIPVHREEVQQRIAAQEIAARHGWTA